MLWSELLTELRFDNNDAGAAPRFSDYVMWRYVRDAVIDISRYPALSLRKDDVVLAQDIATKTKFSLPADFVSEVAVQCPVGTFLEPRQARPGVTLSSSTRVQFYRVDGERLYLNADPGTNSVTLSYYATHPFPTSETDISFLFTIPDRNIELIGLYVKGRVNEWIRLQGSKLDRFKISGGARDDNPMLVETKSNEKTYAEAIRERIPARSVNLYRPRRRL